jgi:hypothetical protein
MVRRAMRIKFGVPRDRVSEGYETARHFREMKNRPCRAVRVGKK